MSFIRDQTQMYSFMEQFFEGDYRTCVAIEKKNKKDSIGHRYSSYFFPFPTVWVIKR